MKNKVYVFNNPERDNTESARHLALAVIKQPALYETIKFIFDGCHGHNPEISEKTIDDAFDYLINCEKATLYAQELTKDIRDKLIKQIELNSNIRKEWFKSILKVKEE
ncbi:MAG: hypothetical protein IKK64_01625 [Bacteroidales bacterium]|nr:hypothetical protein [Bacteroidales bacterium]